MADKLTFLKLIELTLDKIRKPLTPAEIWQNAVELKLAEQVSTRGKTPWATIGAQLYLDIRDNPKTIFFRYSKRPVRFYLRKYADKKFDFGEYSIQAVESPKFDERDLHPLLVKFANANAHFRAYIKTIYHENSVRGKKGFNEWLHPDLVGVYFPFDDFDESTLKLQEQLSLSSVKLFSFELKINLNLLNLRESYFQSVSNSSWAHEGYLVALTIEDDDPNFLDELKRLNNAFGIGIIKLNPQNIHESEILFLSNIKKDLDWDTIDRLSTENKDFQNFIKDIIEDTEIGKVKSKYDKLFNDEEAQEYIKKKNII